MAFKIGMIERYGVHPPETSPFWGDDNYSFNNEDKIITSIDLQNSFKKLDEIEKEILELCNEGYSIREISVMQDIPRATVQDIKDKAIRKLQEMMNGGVDIFE